MKFAIRRKTLCFCCLFHVLMFRKNEKYRWCKVLLLVRNVLLSRYTSLWNGVSHIVWCVLFYCSLSKLMTSGNRTTLPYLANRGIGLPIEQQSGCVFYFLRIKVKTIESSFVVQKWVEYYVLSNKPNQRRECACWDCEFMSWLLRFRQALILTIGYRITVT